MSSDHVEPDSHSLRSSLRDSFRSSGYLSHNSNFDDSGSALSHSSGNGRSPTSSPNRIKRCRRRISTTLLDAPSQSVKSERLQRATQDFTVNKLRFHKLGLIGREDELEILKGCLERDRELVLLQGESGTGKSALAQSLQPKVEARGGLYISGKFDYRRRNSYTGQSTGQEEEPYAGIASAGRDLCGQLLNLQQDGQHTTRKQAPKRAYETEANEDTDDSDAISAYQGIQEELRQELQQGEWDVLLKVIPEVKEIVGHQQSSRSVHSDDSNDNNNRTSDNGPTLSEAKKRTAYAFRRFIQIISRRFPPLVLVLDDLQWADPASIELIESLSTDSQIHNFLLMGCFRANEVDDKHLLSQMIRGLPDHATPTKITVGNLDVPQIQALLSELLSSQETQGLAAICHKKTLGNVFFLIQYLTLLHDQKLLKYNLGTFQWTWNESEIELQTSSTENVVSILQSRMLQGNENPETNTNHHLTSSIQQLLQVGACLGSSFEGFVLNTVWRALGHPSDSHLRALLEHAMSQGFLEPMGLSGYRFVHDTIQEAALLLVPDRDSLRDLKQQVGCILVSKLAPEVLEAQIFVAVNLLNEGHDSKRLAYIEKQQIQMAEFNLRAAQKAIGLSAFDSASRYALLGLEWLPPDTKWSQHYPLTLDLYSTAAEMQGLLGFIKPMEEYCNEVLAQTECPLADKFRVYNVLQGSMLDRNNQKEALNLGLKILRQLKCNFPKQKHHLLFKTVAGIGWAKRSCKLRTPEEIKRLPRLMDPQKIQAMKLLDRCSTACYVAGGALLPLVILKRVQWSLKYGLCMYSPPAFGDLGLLLAGVLKDFEGAGKIADYTLKMLEELECRSMVARTLFVLNCFVLPWVRPTLTLYKPLLHGYHEGMATGDTSSAMYCIYFYILLSYQSGKKLKLLEADCKVYIKQMQELKTDNIAAWTQMLWETILILRDQSALNDESVAKTGIPAHKNQLYALYGHYTKGAELSIARGDSFGREAPGHPLQMSDALFRAISCYDVARKTKDKKYKKEAKKHRSSIKSWLEKGNPNVGHYNFLLDAEHAALKGQQSTAIKFYQKAKTMASRSGFLQDAALANERFAEFRLHDMMDQKNAAKLFEEARNLYSEWGALGKADMIQEKYVDLWPKPKEISIESEGRKYSNVSCIGDSDFFSTGDMGEE